MKQVTQHFRTGKLTLQELPTPACRPGWLLVATRASLISAGTEKMLMDLANASLAGKAMARPDLVRQVVDKVRREGLVTTLDKVWTKLDTPIPLGYSCAGQALEVGLNVEVSRGDRVACAGAGWANHAEYNLVPRTSASECPTGSITRTRALSRLERSRCKACGRRSRRLASASSSWGSGCSGCLRCSC
jgi:hypothetical protein